MITAGYVFDEIAAAIHLNDKDTMADIKHSCMLAYYKLIGMVPWQACRRKLSATISGTVSYLLPADLVGIEAIYDSSNTEEYYPGTEWGITTTPTWFYKDTTKDSLVLLQNITVKTLANVWTGGTWDASYIGEYVRFGKEPGIYKITAENTFTPRYYGEQLNRVTGTIRPAGTRKLACVDDENDRVAGAMDIYYWAYPAPLYDESQDILLPASRPLELLTLIRMLGTKDRSESAADRYRAEYGSALSEMKAMNPRFIQPKEPVNRAGVSAFNMSHR